MIVDVHMHLYEAEHIGTREPEINDPMPPIGRPVEQFLPGLETIDGRGILLQYNYPETGAHHIPTDYIVDIVKTYPERFKWACCINPTKDGAVEELEDCAKLPGCVGVGEIIPTAQEFYINDKKAYPFYKKCQELGFPLFANCGYLFNRKARLRYADLYLVDDVAIDFPDLKIVLSHFGPTEYDKVIRLLHKHPNVYTECPILYAFGGIGPHQALQSGFPPVDFGYFYHIVYPIHRYFSQGFGYMDKICFASVWSEPEMAVDLYKNKLNRWLGEFNLPKIPEEKIHNIIYENWKQLFPDWKKIFPLLPE